MGCHKSKLQHRGSEADVERGHHINAWEQRQEVHPVYDNLQLNQNKISNCGIQYDSYLNHNLSGNQSIADTRYQTGYTSSYTNHENVTGSFGDAAPSYNNKEFNRVQYLNGNQYCNGSVNNVGVHRIPVINNFTNNNNFSQEQIQHTYFSNPYPNHKQCQRRERICNTSYQEQIMGPPLRPVSRAVNSSFRLARRSSFNDSYRRAYQNNQFNSMVRHGSLENLSGFRNRYFRNYFASDNNLYQNSLVCIETYPRSPNPRRRNSVECCQKRSLKRNHREVNSLSSNSTFSGNSGSVTKNNDQEEPCVKRRPSDIVGPSKDSANNSNDEKKEKEYINCNDKTKTTNKGVEMLSCFDEPFEILDLLMFPDEWSSCDITKTGLVDIRLTSPEGKSVQQYFSRSSQSKDFKLGITKISRIENPFMHSCYLLRKQEMESRNERVDELFLYHGTKKENLDGIFLDNLNWRLFSEEHRFGQGVSFSPLATYSSHYSDRTSDKVMLLFKVLASNSIGGSPDMKVPPIVKSIVYDTSIKDDTSVIVKYSDNEFYPLYKITYTKIRRI